MDYKEKYEQALAKAKEILEYYKRPEYEEVLAYAKDDLTCIFPELKESEDERIRKEILEYFQQFENEELRGVNISDWIAWIEKQDEQKSLNDIAKEVIKDKDAAISFLKSCGIMNEDGELADEYKIEQCEQKPVINTITPEESLGIDSETYSKIVDECIYGENPAWSEEDELHIRELEGLVKRVWAIAEHENDKDTIHEMSDLSFFLKTLKPQLKQEWSEEDEDKMQIIINIIKDSDPDWEELINWLKSLRPQNRWKPSDEQMAVLNEVINYAANSELQHWSSFIYTLLKSLREQLKKLREEQL